MNNKNKCPTVRLRLLALSVLLVTAAGCERTALRTQTAQQIESEIIADREQTRRQGGDVPEDVADALLPTIELNVPSVPEVEDDQRFDITVTDVPARDFFMSLVDGTDYNMVVHPEVTGSITLNLKNVTIPEVLEAARDVFGFEFEVTTYGYQVLPSRLQARIYQINFLNLSRSGNSSTFVSSGTLQQGPSATPAEGAVTQEEVASFGGGSRQSTVGAQVSTQHPKTSFWEELQAAVESIIGTGQGRSVVVNQQGGVVVVRAIPSELREVEAFLRATQLIAQRQVILEAKILEVELSEGYQQGINWTAVAGDLTGLQTGGGTVLVGDTGFSELAGNPVDLTPGVSELAGQVATGFGGVFGLAINGVDFQAFIELLEAQGSVQVLSSPRISTMNNQKAIIKVGSDEFFVTDISTTTITGTATTSTPNVELTPFFSGIALDVTPQVSGNNEVTLHVHPVVSEVVDQVKQITVSGLTQSLPLALSTVRESDTIVRAKSGQIVVIGGLMQDQTEDSEARVPLVSEIPLVGDLFKQKRVSSVRSELVILLRPVVVESSQQWYEAINDSADSFGRLRGTLEAWRERQQGGQLNPASP